MIRTKKKHQEPAARVAEFHRRLPIGAEAFADGIHFRVWAPLRKRVFVVIEGGPGHLRDGRTSTVELKPEADGYFSGWAAEASDGTLYRYCLDDGQSLFPDPASRFQPLGPHGPSQVIDPGKFLWTDREWQGARIRGQIIYEMHIGTFTAEGTWKVARALLPDIAASGLTMLELMPIADFPGPLRMGL